MEKEEAMRQEELRATIAMKNERSKVISNEKEEYKKVVSVPFLNKVDMTLKLLLFEIEECYPAGKRR